MSTPPALDIRDLHCSFGGVQALRGVSLAVAPGARHAVLGPNGAGKTTLFNVISGEVRPDRGRVLVYGRDVTRLPPWRRARLGLARSFQITTLFPELTVRENLMLACLPQFYASGLTWLDPRRQRQLRERVDALLEREGLAHRARMQVKHLSYGEQRLLEIVLAMAQAPRLLLLDEPTSGLAYSDAERVLQRLACLPETVTLLLIEHNLEAAFAVVTTATVLNLGQVIAHGDVATVRSSPLVQEVYLAGGHAGSVSQT